MANLVVIRKSQVANVLPDNAQWMNRFEIPSSSSNRLYTIAQHKEKKHMGCSCPGWKRHRKCQHLEKLGLPCFEQPVDLQLI
jgi:hypothetical protein